MKNQNRVTNNKRKTSNQTQKLYRITECYFAKILNIANVPKCV